LELGKFRVQNSGVFLIFNVPTFESSFNLKEGSVHGARVYLNPPLTAGRIWSTVMSKLK
jgi:hypothetical protein